MDVLHKPHGKHKAKMYSRYPKDKEKEIVIKNYQITKEYSKRQRTRKATKEQPKSNKNDTVVSLYLSIIMFNRKELKSLIKRHKPD
jgi:hypothetical protein